MLLFPVTYTVIRQRQVAELGFHLAFRQFFTLLRKRNTEIEKLCNKEISGQQMSAVGNPVNFEP